MEFRLATAADTTDIAHLIHKTWGTATNEDLIASILTRPERPVWLVRNGASVAGFCASFMTYAADGTPRWEIDLLAVASENRGQGLGRKLVEQSVHSGRKLGAALFRALIAVDNAASARCFEVNGFRAHTPSDLWVAKPAENSSEAPPPPHAHLIQVETLTYTGIWIEGRYDAAALAAAQQLVLTQNRDSAGAVIPEGMVHDAAALQFSHIDTYRWWILSP